jgi:hypothetical protein
MADATPTAARRWTPPAGWLPWLLIIAAVPLIIARPMSPAGYVGLIDLPTLAALAGLLICTTAIERSGCCSGSRPTGCAASGAHAAWPLAWCCCPLRSPPC